MDGLIEFPLLTGSGPQGNVLNGIILKILKNYGMKTLPAAGAEGANKEKEMKFL